MDWMFVSFQNVHVEALALSVVVTWDGASKVVIKVK